MKNTKKSLWGSGLSLLLCFALLIGTTFAWFTDSVTNTGNRIESGNLEIDLLMDKAKTGDYQSIADSTGDIFSEQTGNGVLWEPGKTEIVYLAVRNLGSLAVNYNILLDVTDNGLAGALEYVVLDGKQAADLADVDTFEALKAVAGAQIGNVTAGRTVAAQNGTLDEVVNGETNETDYFALAVHMKESAGNEYQDKNITIDVTVVAKQATAETDGFGDDQYDQDAEYVVPISSLEEITQSGAYALDEDIQITDTQPVTIEQGMEVVLDLNGNDIIANTTQARKFVNYGTLTIAGQGTVTNENSSSYGVFDNYGTLTIESGVFVENGQENGAFIRNNNGGVVVINDGDFSTVERTTNDNMLNVLINNLAGGTAVINGGSFESNGNKCALMNTGDMTINGGDIVVNNPSLDSSYYAIVSGGTSGANLNITGGSVKGHKGGVSAIGGTYSITGGTFSADGWYALYVAGEEDTVSGTVSGGVFVCDTQHSALSTVRVGNDADGGKRLPASMTITGGTFYSTNRVATVSIAENTGSLQITGGTFENVDTTYIADGYTATEKDGMFVIAAQG